MLHRQMSFTAALCCLMLLQSAVCQEAAAGDNCTALTEAEAALVGANCSLAADQEKGLVGDNCTTAADCFEGLQCALNISCACPEGCDYIASEVACSCGSDWGDPNVILFLTIGVPFNALLWFGCFYRTKQVMRRKYEEERGSQSTIMKAGPGDSPPMAMTPLDPTANSGNAFGGSPAGPEWSGPPHQPPQWGSQVSGAPNGLPLDTVPPPPPGFYPVQSRS